MKKLAIIGSGDFAKQIADFATQTNEYEVVGFIDNNTKDVIFNGIGIIGSDDDVLTLYKNKVFDYLFIGIGYLSFALREKLFNRFKGKIPFANIIMPGIEIHKTALLGEGVYIGQRTAIGAEAIIEDNVFVHAGSAIAHNCSIGKHTYFSGRNYIAGFSRIGQSVFLGLGVMVSDHIQICDESWIGIGCIVAQNISRPAKYMSPSTRLIPVQK